MGRSLAGWCWMLGMVASLSGCPSPWKVQGGPPQCLAMCKAWGMELTGMVGVGDQGRSGGGASACVCEMPRTAGSSVGASGTAASTSAAIVAMQAASQQAAAQAAAHH
ncbi:MAG: hypothetical protein QM778_07000 [Myxococcales bacterium]